MGLFRLLFFVALIITAFWLWRRFIRPALTAQKQHQKQTPPPSEPRPMVRCAYCQTHVPKTQAIQDGDRWFCSQAHLEQDRTTP